MCQAIRFNKDEFSEEILKKHHLQITDDEVRVYFVSHNAFLPILFNGENRLVQWGNKRTSTASQACPYTGFCKIESFQAGKWQWLHPLPITILASSAFMNGIWFQVREGIQGLLIKDKNAVLHAYILTQPSTHYFRTMTGAERMPMLVNQVL